MRTPRVQLNFRVPAEDLARWKASAKRAGLPFSRWLRTALNRFCPGYTPPASQESPQATPPRAKAPPVG